MTILVSMSCSFDYRCLEFSDSSNRLGKRFYLDWLAVGAEVATAVADRDTLDGGGANGAEPTTKVMSNPKLKVGCSQFTTGAEVGIHASSLITNG